MIIAIDGPAGSGKSTIAKLLAQKLGIEYIDSGAIYRTFTLYGINTFPEGFQGHEQEITDRIISDPQLVKISYENHTQIMWLDNVNISREIRDPGVTEQVKFIADFPGCRDLVNRKMRVIAGDYPVVIDGRDIGTIVFPDCPHKFFLDAGSEIRAERRAKDLDIQIGSSEFKELLQNIETRDKNDRERKIAPLKQAQDAVYIDTSNLKIEEVVSLVLSHYHRSAP
jgi:CMP/dCMP kinase